MLVVDHGMTVPAPAGTVAVMWFVKAGVSLTKAGGWGSKNSGHVPPPVQRPFVQVGAAQLSVPVTVEVVEALPVQTAVAVAIAGGGGALSWTARTDQQLPKVQVLVRSAY